MHVSECASVCVHVCVYTLMHVYGHVCVCLCVWTPLAGRGGAPWQHPPKQAMLGSLALSVGLSLS